MSDRNASAVRPASAEQRRLWLIDRIAPGGPAYNMPSAVAIDGPLELERLRAAFDALVERHEVLGSAFFADAAGVYRRSGEVPPRLVAVDVSGDDDAEGRAVAAIAHDALQPFDLERGPLVRAMAIRVAPGRTLFACNVHHIVCDDWSQQVLLDELFALYHGAALPPLPPGAAAAEDAEPGDADDAHRSYWSEQLRGVVPSGLRTDEPRPRAATFGGRNHAVELDGDTLARLIAIQRDARATPFEVVTAAVKILLHRYSGDADVVVGAPFAGRHRAEDAGRVGNFVNMLVLRDRLAGADTFADVLAAVMRTTRAAAAHASYSFDRIVRDLAVPFELGRTPLFDVAVIFQEASAAPRRFGSLAVTPVVLDNATAKFDLSWYFTLADGRLRIVLNYRTDLFHPATAARMTAHLCRLLQAIAAEPGRAIAELEIVPDDERARLLGAFNDTACAYPAGGIVELFEMQAARAPDAIALAAEDDTWTYARLDARANEIAGALRERYGVRSGDRVALLLAPQFELAAAILGVMKAGAAYVPLDAIYPPERLAFIVGESRPRLLVTDGEPIAFDVTVPVVAVGELTGAADAPAERPGPHDAAYVIYTSGSTGVPKGCCIEHRNVVRLIRNARMPFDFHAGDTWVMAHSPCFDFSVWELFGALLNGGRVVLADRATVRDFDRLLALVRRHRVTVLNQTPAAFAGLMDAERRAPVHDLDRHLRYVIFGGDRLEPSRLREWAGWYPPERVALVNMYGITETTVHVTFGRLDDGDVARRSGGSPIGVPLPETTVYAFNEARRLQPIGVPGELYVGGSGVCRGYVDRPELDRERFVENPYRPGERLYRSGDVGRWTADGRLEHFGRNDRQVQVRGYRVELGEIEAALTAFPAVGQAHVVGRDGPGGTELVAYVVASPAPDARALAAHLGARLPSYMLPAHIVALDALPLTANNKVDDAALPAPGAARLAAPVVRVPRDDLERRVHDVWCATLGITGSSIDESFFLAGGDSIRIIALIGALHDAFGVRVSVRDVVTEPTIAGIARALRAGGAAAEDELDAARALLAAEVERLRREPAVQRLAAAAEEVLPVTDVEAGMLFHGLLEGEASVYHDQFAYQIGWPDFDDDVFRTTLERLAAKHAILRTSFHLAEEPVQVVHRSVAAHVAVEDLRGAPADSLDALVQERLDDDRRRGFDPAQPGLWRMTVLRTAPAEIVLIWTHHHAIMDGWSNAGFMAELLAAYRSVRADAAFRPEPLRAGYRDVVADQLRVAAAADVAAFWRADLAGAEKLPLPFGAAVADARSRPRHSAQRSIAPAVGTALAALARRSGVPVREVYLAAFARWLEVACGRRDVLFGVVGHLRPSIPDGDRIVGCCLNSVPFRTSAAGTPTAAQRVGLIHERVAALRGFDRLSTRRIAAAAGAGSGDGNVLFDILFNFIDFHVLEGIEAGVLASSRTIARAEATNTLLDVSVSETFGDRYVRITYPAGAYDDAGIDRVFATLLNAFERFATEPDAPVQARTILGAGAERIARQSAGPRTAYPAVGIAALVGAAAERAPERAAIRCDGRTLTYAELTAAADRVACALVAAGIAPEERIAVCIPRSEWTIVAMLGVLRAGGAYVPVDPDFPPSRIDFILRDSGCRFVLTAPGSPEVDVPGTARLDVRAAVPADVALPAAAGGERLAYVIYTSGSTGVPKGVLVEQRSVVRLACATDYIAIAAHDGIAQAGSIAFDASTFEIWGALMNGATVVMLDPVIFGDPAALRAGLRDGGVSVLFLTTSVFNQVAEADPAAFAELRVLLTGGEHASPRHVAAVRASAPELDLLHVYGPTENTTFSTWHRVRTVDGETVPIGRAIANSSAYLLDEAGEVVADGVVGEICTGGDGVARGYLNAAEATARAFVADPFVPGGRLYRTGDLGRRGRDGEIAFVGRADQQVKVRGFRVEPGEVEATVLAHPAVADAVVVARRGAAGTMELVAYYTLRAPIAPSEVRAFLGDRLPRHMIPSYLVPLAEMPISYTGKVDRAALPAPEAAVADAPAPEAPRTAAEALLADVWCALLGRTSIGRDDDYFELGGDSIKAIQLASRLRAAGWNLALRDLFASPTIAKLAPKLVPAAAPSPAPELSAEPGPLAPAQRWFLDAHHGRIGRFNMSIRVRATGRVDRDRLTAAVAALWREHDALRWTFDVDGRAYRTSALQSSPPPLQIVSEAGAAQVQPEFALARGPLVAAALVAGAEHDEVLLIAHHLVTDGVSLRILIEDLAAAYRGERLPAKTAPFGAWTRHAERWAQGAAARAEAEWWVRASEGGERLAFGAPTENRYGDCRSVERVFAPAQTTALLRAGGHDLDPAALVLTALTRAVAGRDGRRRLDVLLEGHGRDPLPGAPDVSRTVGWFTALFPFGVALEGDGLLEQARRTTARLRAVPQGGSGFGILRTFAPPAVRERLPVPLPGIAFNYLGAFDAAGSSAAFVPIGEAPGRPIDPDVLRTTELDVTAAIVEGRLHLALVYASRQLERAAVEEIADAMQADLLAAGDERDGAVPTRFRGIDADDLARVLSDLR